MNYKLYELTDDIYKYYLEDTKNGKTCSKECVERKLLAMMLCAPVCKDNGIGCKKFQFGTFNILIRKDSDEIGMLYWTKQNVYITKEISNHMKNLYNILGLTEDGLEIVSEIDESKLEDYTKKYNLSNTGVWTNYYKTVI